MNCQYCQSSNTKKNGRPYGKQRYKCKDCNRVFTPGGVGHRQSIGDRAMSNTERTHKRRRKKSQENIDMKR